MVYPLVRQGRDTLPARLDQAYAPVIGVAMETYYHTRSRIYNMDEETAYGQTKLQTPERDPGIHLLYKWLWRFAGYGGSSLGHLRAMILSNPPAPRETAF